MMLGSNIIEGMDIIIITFIIIFFIKNYIIHTIESDNTSKNILLTALLAIILICSAFSLGYSIDLNGVLTRLLTEHQEILEHQKYYFEHRLFVLGVIQGISLLMLTILFRNIKNEIKKNINDNSKKRWNWDKIKL